MEEDIKRLEEIIENYKKHVKYSGEIEEIDKNMKALQNIMAKIKLYEGGKALSKKQESMILKVIAESAEEQITKEMKNYILKSKVIELKETIHNDLDVNGITRGYQLIIDRYFDELLED